MIQREMLQTIDTGLTKQDRHKENKDDIPEHGKTTWKSKPIQFKACVRYFLSNFYFFTK